MVAKHFLEHVAAHSQRKRRRNVFDERVELVLLLHRKHDRLEVLAYIFSKVLRQIHIMHRSVCSVNDLLLLLGLAADLGNENGQLSENVGLENGTCQVDDDHKDDLWELLRAHLVTANDEHRVVEADEVQEDLLLVRLILHPVIVVAVVEVVGRDPRLITAVLERQLVGLLAEEEPHARHQVQVDDKKHVIVEHLHHDLRAFFHV
mmetsp:Transcript_30599/g.40713  ORF Transcript_30599/g.40713 Transcript_30599/m.40713 type:complete len:205 (-) Transcript_30599:864-1478(-)